MTSRPWNDDDRLLGALGEALRTAQPGCGRTHELGVAAFTWHGIDEELEFASLVHDSLLDANPVVRGAPGDVRRTVLFESKDGSIEIERRADALVGQVIPAGSGALSLVTASGHVVHAEVDELGCFSLDRLPPEPVRFRWRTPTANLVTDWVRL